MSVSDAGAGIGQGIASLAILLGAAGKGGERERKRMVREAEGLEEYLPDYDFSRLLAPHLQRVGDLEARSYSPFVAGPVSLAEDSPARQNILSALSQIERIGEEGLPMVDALRADEARRSVEGAATRGRESALRGLRERGRLSGGDEVAARMIGNQQASELARGLGADLHRSALLRRADALSQAAALSSGLRGQDLSRNRDNASFQNRFNEWVSQLGTQARARNTANEQAVAAQNLGERQRIADTNELARSDTDKFNLTYGNQLRGREYQDRLEQNRVLMGALGQLGQYRDAQQAARENAILGIGEGVGRSVGGIGDFFMGGIG